MMTEKPTYRKPKRRIAFIVTVVLVIVLLFLISVISVVFFLIVPSSTLPKGEEIKKGGADTIPAEGTRKDALNWEFPQWIPPEVCGSCHSDNLEKWNGSMHAYAFEDPVFLASLTRAKKDGAKIGKEREVLEFCIKCHAPLSFPTSNMLPMDGSAMSKVEREGVQCDFCHRVTKVKVSNAQFKLDLKSITKRGPYKDSYSSFHDTSYSKLHTESEFCSMCHDVVNPLNGLRVEQTYTEWKNSVYSGGKGHSKITCQDCHMKPESGRPADSPVYGGERSNFFRHYFLGGNAWIPKVMGSEDHPKWAVEMLQSAAKLSLEGQKTSETEAKLKVTVANIGAGHKLPTGYPEGRQMWLHIIVKDEKGALVFESGAIDSGSYLKRKATDGSKIKVYEVKLGIKQPNGKIEESFHFALNDTLVSDNRIPPKEKDITIYEFGVPEGRQRLKVTAVLNYQSESKEYIDFLGESISPGEPGDNILEIWKKHPAPVVEMAKATTEIP